MVHHSHWSGECALGQCPTSALSRLSKKGILEPRSSVEEAKKRQENWAWQLARIYSFSEEISNAFRSLNAGPPYYAKAAWIFQTPARIVLFWFRNRSAYIRNWKI